MFSPVGSGVGPKRLSRILELQDARKVRSRAPEVNSAVLIMMTRNSWAHCEGCDKFVRTQACRGDRGKSEITLDRRRGSQLALLPLVASPVRVSLVAQPVTGIFKPLGAPAELAKTARS